MTTLVRKTKSLVSALILISGFSACNYSIQKNAGSTGTPPGSSRPGENNGNTGGTQPPTSPTVDADLNFENVFNTSIKTSCFGCHAAPRNASGVNLETYESVFANREAIEHAVSSREMPDGMGRTMSDAARDLLLRWLAAGAPKEAPAAAQPSGEVAAPALFKFDRETGLFQHSEDGFEAQGVSHEIEL